MIVGMSVVVVFGVAFSFMLGENYSGDSSLCCCVRAMMFQQ